MSPVCHQTPDETCSRLFPLIPYAARDLKASARLQEIFWRSTVSSGCDCLPRTSPWSRAPITRNQAFLSVFFRQFDTLPVRESFSPKVMLFPSMFGLPPMARIFLTRLRFALAGTTAFDRVPLGPIPTCRSLFVQSLSSYRGYGVHGFYLMFNQRLTVRHFPRVDFLRMLGRPPP